MQKGMWFNGSGVRKFNFCLWLTYSLNKIITNQYTNDHNSKYTKKFTQKSMFWFCVPHLCLLNSQTSTVFYSYENGAQRPREILCAVLGNQRRLHEVTLRPSLSILSAIHTLRDLVVTTHRVPPTPLLKFTLWIHASPMTHTSPHFLHYCLCSDDLANF